MAHRDDGFTSSYPPTLQPLPPHGDHLGDPKIRSKTQLIESYARLANALRETANSMTEFMSLMSTSNPEEIYDTMVHNNVLPPPMGSFFNESSSPQGVTGKRVAEDAAPVEGRKRRRSRRPKNSDLPKRPPSAYILFQNEVRNEMKARNPTQGYKDLLVDIGTRWKSISEEERKPFNDDANAKMEEYKKQHAEYIAAHPEAVAGLERKGSKVDPQLLGQTASHDIHVPSVHDEAPDDDDEEDEEDEEDEVGQSFTSNELNINEPESPTSLARSMPTPSVLNPISPTASFD